ncbi:hypothetical protein [Peterkaempfera griseoplana]|uniref:hypothetical protein n=1 Tax=Peterkaempfera griseoplana TaxID=66896 RepID=UPI0006E213C2|nr:hypothetical protein [Peterkaempfera griseoplana]
MSRRVNRRRQSARPPYGGLLPWLLSLPARLRVRGLLILAVMLVAMGAYGRAMVTAPPMPPGKAPAVEQTAGTPAARTAAAH